MNEGIRDNINIEGMLDLLATALGDASNAEYGLIEADTQVVRERAMVLARNADAIAAGKNEKIRKVLADGLLAASPEVKASEGIAADRRQSKASIDAKVEVARARISLWRAYWNALGGQKAWQA